MVSETPLVIGYAGTLVSYDPAAPSFRNSFFKDWFWSYSHLATDPSTRSPYFLFLALQFLNKKYGITGKDIRVHLWGNIDKKIFLQARSMGIADMVLTEGHVSKEESLKRTASCDILFLPLESGTEKGEPLFIPGKLFEYMNAGKPVLALSGKCDAADILLQSGLGMIFDPTDTAGIAAHLKKLLYERGLLSSYISDYDYIRKYSFASIAAQMAKVFREVLHD